MRDKSVKKTRTPAAKPKSVRQPRAPRRPKTSKQFSNNAFRLIRENVVANPREAAPMILEALAQTRAVTTNRDGSIHIAPGQYHHYFETVLFAIEQFEAILVKIDINILSQEALNTLDDQLKKLNLALHKIKPMIDKIHPEEKALETNLMLCEKLQTHEAVLQQRIEVIQLNLHAVVVNPVPIAAIEEPVVTVPEITFNPANVNEMLSEFKANIENIKHTLQATKQERMILELLKKLDTLLNSEFIQEFPQNKMMFQAILNEMDVSLENIVNRLSNHPLSKLRKAFARTKHALSSFSVELSESDIQSCSQHELILTQASQRLVTDEIANETSFEAVLEDVATPAVTEDPSKTQSNDVVRHFVLQTRESVRHDELKDIISLFKENNINIEGKDTIALEEALNEHIFDLEVISKNIDNALHGLFAYHKYIEKYHEKDNVMLAYVYKIHRKLLHYKAPKPTREQHTLFSNHASVSQHARNMSENRDKSPTRKNR